MFSETETTANPEPEKLHSKQHVSGTNQQRKIGNWQNSALMVILVPL